MMKLGSLALICCGVALASDVGKTMVELVQERGYPIEEHFVDTSDGYILGVFRIPSSPFTEAGSRTSDGPKPAVILQHGLLDSSYTWINNFRNESLAYILADMGYDVWMGNSRGNVFSKKHRTLNPDSKEFWSFTYDDMALSDLPALITSVVELTGVDTVSYVGHSQGTIQAFAGLSRNHTVAAKVNFLGALAPIAYLNHQKSLLLSILADLDAAAFIGLFGFKDFLPDNTILQKLAPELCKILPQGCNFALEALCGPSKNLNETRLDVYVSETPAGTSVMNMQHWSQQVKADSFQMFDYGCGLLSCENEEKYGQKTPPLYHLEDLNVPTGLFYGDDDWLGNPTDVQRIVDEAPKNTIVHIDQVKTFAHLDFTWAPSAHQYVYSQVAALIAQYNPLP